MTFVPRDGKVGGYQVLAGLIFRSVVGQDNVLGKILP